MNSIKSSRNSVENLEYIEPEIWKDIEGFDGYYQVSTHGRVRSWKNNRWGRVDKCKLLKPSKHVKGYLLVSLSKKGIVTKFLVHRLVADIFVPNPENKPDINHKDGVKSHNYWKNLEWVTKKENTKHAIDNGLLKMKGVDNPHSKRTEEEILRIRSLSDNGEMSKSELSEKFNLSISNIEFIINRKTWKHI